MYELSSCFWVPEAEFTDSVEEALTVRVFKLDDTEEVVSCFRTDRPGYVGLPRLQGLRLFPGASYRDARSEGALVQFPKKVVLRDYQEPFVEAMLGAAGRQGDYIAKAATGKGKTVAALALIQKLGRSAVVVVDQENLLDQWVERCVEHLGLSPDEVGVVQGPRCDYEGKAITVCMVQTLARRVFSPEFYNAFGVAVFDECHTAGAPTFSRALMQFSARVRVGLSATPKRKDALDRAILWNLGSVGAVLSDTPGRSSVYVLESYGVYSWRVNNSKMVGRFINEVVADTQRNLTIAQAILWLYESGREVLVVGDRIGHLCSLMALAEALGLPSADMGLYSKCRTVFQYEKDPRPLRRPPGAARGVDYTPIRLSLVQKAIPKKERDFVKDNARVIFATYGVIAKGVDIPRLSAGIDATPRSEATQVLGRILRVSPGKLRPIWVTLADVNSFRSLYQLANRMADYESSNAEVYVWDFAKGRIRLDVRAYRKELALRIADLRQGRAIMRLGESGTTAIPVTPAGSASFPARRIVGAGRSPKVH